MFHGHFSAVLSTQAYRTWDRVDSQARIHQLYQLFAPDIPIGLRRVEATFASAEGFEFGGGYFKFSPRAFQ